MIFNPFQHTTNQTLNTSHQKHEKYLFMKFYLPTKVENIVAKGEIAHFEQFLLLSQCFQESSAAHTTNLHVVKV